MPAPAAWARKATVGAAAFHLGQNKLGAWHLACWSAGAAASEVVCPPIGWEKSLSLRCHGYGVFVPEMS